MDDNMIKKWVEETINKGYDRYDVEDILSDREKYTDEYAKKVLKEFDKQTEMKEGLELGFFQKRRIKKLMKHAKRKAEATLKILDKLNKDNIKLNKKSRKELDELKDKMIISIIGDPEQNIIGLISVFDIEDDKGQTITKNKLKEMDIEEVTDLLEILLSKLEKEI